MPQPLPRAYRRQLEAQDERKIDRILVEVGETQQPASAAGATAAGDWQRLRGLPAIGRGCSGAIRGTRPGDGLFRS